MRKRLIALALSVSVALCGINSTTIYADSKLTKVNILQNKGDTYTLENYVSSLEEAEELQTYYFLNNISEPYKMTIDAKSYSNLLRYDEEHERIDFFGDGFIWKIDNGLRKYCNDFGGVRNLSSENEVLVDGNGKKYIVLTLQNYGVDKYYKISSEMQEVKKKFLATMPKLDEMSDYEKVLGILSFMSYINYDYDSLNAGKTVDDAYTALVEGRATCVGFADAFDFLAKIAGVEDKIAWGEYRNDNHAWNVVKICGKWYETEPQNVVIDSPHDVVKNFNLTDRGPFLSGTTDMDEWAVKIPNGYIHPCIYLDESNELIRDTLPVSDISYKDYKGHNYTNHIIKWNGNKATFYRTCSECGEYENDGIEQVDVGEMVYKYVNRDYIGTDCDVTKVSEKKCGDATVTKYEASVTVDGKNYTSEHTVIDGEASHVVKDSDIKVVKKATCTEEGKVEKTCETCGYTWTENIPKTEHHYVTTTTKLDTCEEKSEYTVEKCSECGDVKSTSKKLYYSAHDFQFTSHKKEPTCTEKGEDLYTCTICNGTETREVAATGHDTELVNVKEPTCTDFGYTGDEVCKKCNQVVKSGKKIEPNGHKYLATMFTKYEIQESMGLKYKYSYEAEHWICKNCDYERIDTDYTTRKLVGWILADGTEVEKEDGCNYVYIRDENGNFVPQKVEKTTTTRPTAKPSTNVATKAPRETTAKVKVPAKVKISSAKNLKGKKIAIKWKKVKTATKYQVKAVLGSKAITKTTTKTSYTIKKLKRKKTYKIYVRAYNKSGYGKWSKAKKVKVNK